MAVPVSLPKSLRLADRKLSPALVKRIEHPASQKQYPPFGSGFETRQNTGSMMGGHTERASGYHGAGRGR